ncbi:MAG TPA: RNA 2',3'-cyclic phosphodiesterase [Ramlibacter sp.]|jgi:2'-5' RNA ligase|uniref:RNA 2',3'-cyclic phosphodiesterase n=1 Tax=Ramlibacter sp. TaxID=1917967 RepID=UPI002D46F0BC|nr:RNA 2',3'-cyclic phosphodiesterase [Ramlibacter sp.]HZY18162.1 RNA 2',3'-cyclic phosphodiesterase [Ramlibacter sp.]
MDRQPDSWRLFTAFWPPEPVRLRLVESAARWAWPAGARRTAPERLHVTLHFLGHVPSARVDDFRSGLDVPFEPFVLDLDAGRPQVWPGGIAVLELEAPAALQRLHARLAQALQRLGHPLEARRFRPHVTFARKAGGAQPPAQPGGAGVWAVAGGCVEGGYALVRSIPGAGYVTLHRWSAG